TTRRHFLTASATASALGFAGQAAAETIELAIEPAAGAGASAADAAAIRPFSVNVPDAALADLKRRVGMTRWPERETVADDTQGVKLATMQSLARYWAADYDWRKCE